MNIIRLLISLFLIVLCVGNGITAEKPVYQDFSQVLDNNKKERETKTSTQQNITPLENLYITDTVIVADVLVYERKNKDDSCKNYLLFIEAVNETDIQYGGEVLDGGVNCTYKKYGSKKELYTKPSKRYKVYTKSSNIEKYAFIFLSSSQLLGLFASKKTKKAFEIYYNQFANLSRGTKIKIIKGKIVKKKPEVEAEADFITTNSFKDNIFYYARNTFYVEVSAWEVVK